MSERWQEAWAEKEASDVDMLVRRLRVLLETLRESALRLVGLGAFTAFAGADGTFGLLSAPAGPHLLWLSVSFLVVGGLLLMAGALLGVAWLVVADYARRLKSLQA